MNPSKKWKLEKYIILTSIFQFLFLTKATNIFIDATFKVAPKNFYQVLNIMVYEEKKKFTMPVVHILMSSKSYYSYKKIFQDIKNILNENKIDVDFKNTIINCYFEKSLIKAIREEFKDTKIYGCYFHFVKALWKKSRKLGLTKKKFINNTKIILFAFKIYPFILKNQKKDFILGVYDFAIKHGKDYKYLIKYFKKNWESSDFLNFDVLTNGIIYNRTNNIIECFHNILNKLIGTCHPRISILVEKLSEFSIIYYRRYIEKLFIDNSNKNYSQNIFNDILNFLTEFLEKYNNKIDIKLLIQDTGNTKKSLIDITNKIFENFI